MKTQYEYRICVFCFCILLCGCLGCYGALDLAKGKSNICYVHDKVMTTEEIGIIYIVTSTMGYPGELERLNDYGEEEYRG